MPMRVCKLCFKNIKDNSLIGFINTSLSLCPQCYRRLSPKFKRFYVFKYHALALYDYDQDIKALLYQLKGCFDYELGSSFLDRYLNEMRLRYHDYFVIPIPSYKEDDDKREFNHVQEIFKGLKLPLLTILQKTDHYKQATNNREQRKQIGKYMILDSTKSLKGKKVLLVDDVFTTGSTMKAAIKLVEQLKPKDIKILVMSKTTNARHYN